MGVVCHLCRIQIRFADRVKDNSVQTLLKRRHKGKHKVSRHKTEPKSNGKIYLHDINSKTLSCSESLKNSRERSSSLSFGHLPVG